MYSTRGIFLLIAYVSMALVVAQQLSGYESLFVVLPIGATIAFCLPTYRRRWFIYGSLIGIVVGLIGTSAILHTQYSQLPDVPLPMGRGQNDPNATQRPEVERLAWKSAEPYAVTVGFVVGGSIGLALTALRNQDA